MEQDIIDAAMKISEWIRNKCDPYKMIIIDSENIRLVQDIEGIPNKNNTFKNQINITFDGSIINKQEDFSKKKNRIENDIKRYRGR